MGGEPSFDDPGLGVPTEEAIQEIIFPTAAPGEASVGDVIRGDLAAPQPVPGVGTRPGIGPSLGQGGSALGEAAASVGNVARSILPGNKLSFGFFDLAANLLTAGKPAAVKLIGSLLGTAAGQLAPELTLGSVEKTPQGEVKIAAPIIGWEAKTGPGFVSGEPVPDAYVEGRMWSGLTAAEARGEIPYDPDRPESLEGPPEGGYPEGLFDPLIDRELEDDRNTARRGRWSLLPVLERDKGRY